MVKKYFEAEVPDDQHPDASRDNPDAVRATLRNSANKLVGQMNLVEIDPDDFARSNDDRDNNLFGQMNLVEMDSSDFARPNDSSLEIDPNVAILGGLALVGLTVTAISAVSAAVGSARSRRESRRELEWRIAEARQDGSQAAVAGRRVAAPAGWYDDGSGQLRWWDGQEWTQQYYTAAPPIAAPAGWYDDGSGQLRWWDGQEWTQQYYTAAPPVAAPAGWYDDGPGRQRWWDGRDWTEHYQGSGTRAELPPELRTALGGRYSNDLERGHGLPSISLSRAQWEEQARVMFQERVISELQWRLLSNARIEGADSDLLQWQAWLRTLTAEEFSLYIDQYVASQPAQALELATAGWYDDGSGRQRWWDGLEWTGYFQTDESRMLPPGQ